MGTLTIDYPDAEADRIRTAFGNGQLASPADIRAEIARYVKEVVVSYEARVAQEAEDAKIETAKTRAVTAIDSAVSSAEAIEIT